ncbi:MAG: hypothetical protein ACKVVP_08870 [Chloroflexota bacterium]
MEPHADTEQLDLFLREVVVTLQAATGQGLRHVHDDPALTDKVIQDCTELIGQIMDGDAQGWLH